MCSNFSLLNRPHNSLLDCSYSIESSTSNQNNVSEKGGARGVVVMSLTPMLPEHFGQSSSSLGLGRQGCQNRYFNRKKEEN